MWVHSVSNVLDYCTEVLMYFRPTVPMYSLSTPAQYGTNVL